MHKLLKQDYFRRTRFEDRLVKSPVVTITQRITAFLFTELDELHNLMFLSQASAYRKGGGLGAGQRKKTGMIKPLYTHSLTPIPLVLYF